MSKFGFDPVPGMEEVARQVTEPPALIPPIGLRVIAGPKAGVVLSTGRSPALVGRNDPPEVTVDIDLSDAELGSPPMVSRRHLQIERDAATGHTFMTDLGSTNGTWIDNVRLAPRIRSNPLTVPARVRLGNLEFETVYVDI